MSHVISKNSLNNSSGGYPKNSLNSSVGQLSPKAVYNRHFTQLPFAHSPGKVVKGMGVVEEKNIRFRKEMEDGHLFCDGLGKNKNIALACVFDGHGGTNTMRYLTSNFQRVFEKNLPKNGNMEHILSQTFSDIDNEMKNNLDNGATAAVIVIVVDTEGTKETVYSANCGDARSVLVKRSGAAVRLSEDHKVSLPKERDRIVAAGGFVAMGRVNAVLAVSRAFGDHGAKELVVSTPHLSSTPLTPEDTHVIIACDGVWDVVSDEEAAALVSRAKNPQEAAAALKDLALKKGTTDNVTAMVVQLT